jgi:hypothetical protein
MKIRELLNGMYCDFKTAKNFDRAMRFAVVALTVKTLIFSIRSWVGLLVKPSGFSLVMSVSIFSWFCS